MGNKSKTRYIIEAGGAQREVFSVREQNNGELRILGKLAERYRHRTGSDISDLIDDYQSIHYGKTPGEIGITRNIKTSSKVVKHNTSVLVENGWTCFPVIFSRLQALDMEKYLSKPRKDDRVVSLGNYDHGKVSLFYGLFVTLSNSLPLPHPKQFKYELTRFRLFDLHLLYSFMQVTSLFSGYNVQIGSTTGIINDLKIILPNHSSLPPLGTDDVWPTIANLLPRFSNQYIAAAKRDHPALFVDPTVEENLSKLANLFNV